jgi:copper resistance protein B
MHGAVTANRVLVDRFEAKVFKGRNGYAFEGDAWYGGDVNKFWLKGDAHGEFSGSFEGVELQSLWSHAIGPWFDAQAGIRQDLARGPDRTHVVLGVQGLAPYWIEVEAAVFLSNKGDFTAAIEAEHDARITQKLILQPRAELAVSLQDVPEIGIGKGLSEAGLGVRFRYEVAPEFAPYLGIEWSGAFGRSARIKRAEGERPRALAVVTGLRFWF